MRKEEEENTEGRNEVCVIRLWSQHTLEVLGGVNQESFFREKKQGPGRTLALRAGCEVAAAASIRGLIFVAAGGSWAGLGRRWVYSSHSPRPHAVELISTC